MSAHVITISTDITFGEVVETVNARDLHRFLEIGKDFSSWIKERIDQYGFEPDKDFVEVFTKSGENSSGGRPRRDYHISLDMAKELSMVERNDKGKQARQYFIECERRAKQAVTAQPALPDFNDPAVAARAWADQVEKVQQTRKELTHVRDELGATRAKVETYSDALNRIAKSGETFPITEAAKLLKMKPGKLFAWMANNRWIYRGRSDGPWKAYQDKIDLGLMWVSIFQPDKGDGAFKVHQQARVTGKGLIYLAQLHEVEIIWKWRDECRGSQG